MCGGVGRRAALLSASVHTPPLREFSLQIFFRVSRKCAWTLAVLTTSVLRYDLQAGPQSFTTSFRRVLSQLSEGIVWQLGAERKRLGTLEKEADGSGER